MTAYHNHRITDLQPCALLFVLYQTCTFPVLCYAYLQLVCVCESYIGKPIGTRAVPQFTTGVAKPLTQIEPGKTEHHPPV